MKGYLSSVPRGIKIKQKRGEHIVMCDVCFPPSTAPACPTAVVGTSGKIPKAASKTPRWAGEAEAIAGSWSIFWLLICDCDTLPLKCFNSLVLTMKKRKMDSVHKKLWSNV